VKSNKRNKNTNIWLPQPRVLSMMITLAIIMAALFSLMLQAVIPGLAVGLGFAGAFYLIVVVGARKASKKLPGHHSGSHRGRI